MLGKDRLEGRRLAYSLLKKKPWRCLTAHPNWQINKTDTGLTLLSVE